MRNFPSNEAPRGSCEAGFALTDVIMGLINAFRNPRFWPLLAVACSYEPPTNHVSWALDGGTRSCNGACYDRSVELAQRDRSGINGRPGVEEIEPWVCQPGTARDADGNPIGDDEQVPAGEGLCAPREEFDCNAARADRQAQVEVPALEPITCTEACRRQDPPLDCNFGVTPGGGRRLPNQPLRPGDTAVCFGETPPGVQCP